MQVYRHMDIGSAKIRPEEMDGVKHYLIDVLEPTEEFHVVRFQKLAKQAMEEIYENGLIPIVTGGTGFYIQALLYDIDFTESREDPDYRRELSLFADRYGEEALHEKLREVDEEAANEIHPNNRKRVIRALNFTILPGKRFRCTTRKSEKESPYQSAYFVLNDERSRLYERIDARVDQMLEDGACGGSTCALKSRDTTEI